MPTFPRPAALAAGLFLFAAGAPAASVLTDSVSQKVMKADVAFLEKGLSKTPVKREIPTLKAAAMLLALNAQQAKAGYRDPALGVAAEITDKKFDAAKAGLAALASAKGSADGDKPLSTLHKFDLAELMSCFRATPVGGMNLDKDIKAYGKKLTDLDAAQVVAGRVALIAVYTKELPPAEAAAPDKKAQWEKLSEGMGTIAGEIAVEAAKGGAADKGAIEKQFVKLNANCNACHTAFRQ